MSSRNLTAVPQGQFIGMPFPGQGKTFFVCPSTGADGARGDCPARALKTLAKALSLCTAGQNDTVYLFAESNTAASTTDYQSTTLDWNKDLVHLIGINCGNGISQRSRVALISTYATASNLFTLSANGCLIQNIEFFAGVADVNPTGCFKVTGQRNHIKDCHIAGMGNANNDIAGAYSLYLLGAAENLFENCVIGVDTVTLGANANSQIRVSTAATRNRFKGCTILTYTNHATNHVFLRAPTSSLDRWLIFEDCSFLNAVDSASTALTYAFIVVSNGGAVLLIGRTSVFGATDWNNDSGNVYGMNGTAVAATYGLAVAVTK